MTSSIASFHPPYLHYDTPADLDKIRDRMEELREKAFEYQRLKDTPAKTTLSSHFGRRPSETIPMPTMPDTTMPVATRAQHFARANVLLPAEIAPATDNSAENTESQRDSAGNSSPNAMKLASDNIDVTPSGVVTMGFNCKALFHATNSLNCAFTAWEILFKDPITGSFTVHGQFLGSTNLPGQWPDRINFEIDFDVYNVPAYEAADKTARFVIQCQCTLSGAWQQSAEVVLDFSAPPCINLNSVSLSENTFVGGENGDEPTMTVVLDAPASPGGQRIDLSVSSTRNAGILGDKFFYIPAGHKSGMISGFLGTEKVLNDQTVDIHVDAGGPATGYATVYLHKKKRF